jgi:hypothetical protein
MKIWIWERIDQVSDNWHSGGGLMVIAHDEAEAWALISAERHVEVTEDEWSTARVFELMGTPTPDVIVFPDAGCC